ncbi:hypothetical protein [Bradyrhizobium sp. 18]|uniref:hypothetical protein n=1 Tax=Bradyrhizobium sp. 18 TaxID=2782657 RepID=UPI001FFB8152|nr:hypothetical protein [Bradyrhizobium sp. 18]
MPSTTLTPSQTAPIRPETPGDGLIIFRGLQANLVVSFYFAKRGFENVARIIKR